MLLWVLRCFYDCVLNTPTDTKIHQKTKLKWANKFDIILNTNRHRNTEIDMNNEHYKIHKKRNTEHTMTHKFLTLSKHLKPTYFINNIQTHIFVQNPRPTNTEIYSITKETQTQTKKTFL